MGPLFAHDPVSAGTVLTTGMGAGAQRAVRAVLPAFRAFYKLRHGIDDAAIAAAPARVRAGSLMVGCGPRRTHPNREPEEHLSLRPDGAEKAPHPGRQLNGRPTLLPSRKAASNERCRMRAPLET